MNQPKNTISQLLKKTFPVHDVFKELMVDTTTGHHQKLISEDGRSVLVLRISHGLYERIPLIELGGNLRSGLGQSSPFTSKPETRKKSSPAAKAAAVFRRNNPEFAQQALADPARYEYPINWAKAVLVNSGLAAEGEAA